MRRADISWTLALCASLAVHAVIVRLCADWYVAHHTVPHLAGFDPTTLALSAEHAIDEVDRLGDSHGTGYATDSSPGDLTLMAQKADEDQSFLSRDPQGAGQIGVPPTQSTAAPGEEGENGATQQAMGVQSPSQPSPRFAAAAPARPSDPSHDPANDPAPGAGPVPPMTNVMLSQATPSKPQQNQQPAKQLSVASARPGRPGINAPAADPAPQAETESDPFAIVGSLEFRPGSTKVRMGRKHRITRPRLSWDTQYDFYGMTRSTLVLDLQLDETGQVVSATVEKSSGSESIDQPCRLAAYQWWFEPAKDALGHPTRDEIKFTIKFF